MVKEQADLRLMKTNPKLARQMGLSVDKIMNAKLGIYSQIKCIGSTMPKGQ